MLIEDNWSCVRCDDARAEFPFALLAAGKVIARFKRSAEADFVIHAVAEIVELRGELRCGGNYLVLPRRSEPC
jgi:hypothetical protein